MSKRFTSFCQAITYMLASFICFHAVNLAAKYDPDLTGAELILFIIVAVTCAVGFFWHMRTVLFHDNQLPATEGWDGD